MIGVFVLIIIVITCLYMRRQTKYVLTETVIKVENTKNANEIAMSVMSSEVKMNINYSDHDE